jgi:4-alpha-glucanotransferase
MLKKKIILGMYSEKPLGIHREDMEYILLHCYKPVLSFLYANENIKFTLYFSAAVFEWVEDRYPEINMLIHDMVKRKQLEILAGGFYDPILTFLPMKDRTQQVELSVTYLRKRFGKRPRTIWLTDQVWNPSLITTFSNCGIQNVLLNTGNAVNRDRLQDPFSMQEIGKSVNIYPILNAHKGITNNSVLQVPDIITKNVFSSNIYSIMIDMNMLISGVILKQGSELVGDLTRLIRDIEKLDIQYTLPRDESEAVTHFPRQYLASGCFRFTGLSEKKDDNNEMLVRYPEMNFLYGRLCYSQKLTSTIKKEKSLKKIVSNEILKGESFGAFTKGDWGGIYLNYMRKENYRHLIEAEKAAREKGLFSSSIAAFDFDFDGIEEYIYRGKNITAIVDSKGGALAELDYLVTSWNYLDTFTAHENEAEESAYSTAFNAGKQNSFIDIFFEPDFDLRKYNKCKSSGMYSLDGVQYNVQKLDRAERTMQYSINVALPFIQDGSITLEKNYSFRTNSIEVSYCIRNNSKKRIKFMFASEQNVSFAYESREFLEINSEDSQHSHRIGEGSVLKSNVKKLAIKDLFNKTLLTFSAEKRYKLFKHSYSTLIKTLFGEEDVYQYTILAPVWDIDLPIQEQWDCSLSFRIEKIK